MFSELFALKEFPTDVTEGSPQDEMLTTSAENTNI